MVAGMSISVPTLRWNDDRRREWGELIREGAATLSRRLGHRAGGSLA
jgi:DNA-binding IclR family transcriptional regulator